MCGIVGSIGFVNANEVVLTGLRRLEYRGYDSCGISYIKNEEIKIYKSIQRIKNLVEQVQEEANISLGHTRWATHGGVNLKNAHPHITNNQKLVMVHNGVIENYKELKVKYCQNINLTSETDTEIILEVLNYFYQATKDMKVAITKFMEVVEGSYACIVYNNEEQDKLYALKNKSPMLIGRAKQGYTISSDPSAVIDKVDDFYQIADKKFIIMDEANNINLYNQNGAKEEINFEVIDMDFEEVTTEDYDTFMLKEIEEQPKALRNMVDNYKNIKLDNKMLTEIKQAKRIYIVASGTSYNSGLAAKTMIQNQLNIPVENVIGSEFGYEHNIIAQDSFFIFLSQSGETADSMLVFNQIKGKYPILAITNVRGSQMDRNADYSLQLFAGIEVAVASTKAYTAQLAMLAIVVNKLVGNEKIYDELLQIADYQEKIIADKEKFQKIAQNLATHQEAFYLGRLTDYALCQEAALKVKEVSYVNVSAFAAGELKHGTISLVDENTILLAIITDEQIAANTRSNLEEVKARGGEVIIFSTSKTAKKEDNYIVDFTGNDYLLPILAILPHQYLAYYTATELNLDVDKPRNLAKSVTVE
ncbi:MAG: glutamine--fructose-6-phosphate transaminase (isomerizing) [Mycoplasmatales bacterium]